MGRSILAVVVGYGVVLVGGVAGALFGALLGGRDLARPMEGGPLSTGATGGVLAVSVVFTVAGGYAAALLARRRELRHGIYLAVVMFVLSLASTVLYWEKQPAWYQLALLVLGPPAAVLGAWLRARRSSTATVA